MSERKLLQQLLNSGAIQNPPEELLEQLIQLGLVSNPVADLTDLNEIQSTLDEPMRDAAFARWAKGVIEKLVAEVAVSRPFVRTTIGFTDGLVTGNVLVSEARKIREQLSLMRGR